jgi:hypothetical protein
MCVLGESYQQQKNSFIQFQEGGGRDGSFKLRVTNTHTHKFSFVNVERDQRREKNRTNIFISTEKKNWLNEIKT